MEALNKRRSVIKGQITRLTSYTKSCNDTTPYDDMLTRLEKLKEHYKNFIQIENEMFSLDHEVSSDIDAIDDNYYFCVSTLQKLMRSKIVSPSSNPNDSIINTSFSTASADFKLPRLTLPTFSGKAREWQSFYDLFKSTVHENTSLSPAQKFQYLIGQLRGPAEALVRHFRVDDASYIEAFQRLEKRYDRKRSIVNEFIQTYIKQPQITKPSVDTVGQMYDTCDEVIRGLKALGPSAETRDCWLIYIAEKKLDDATLQLWRQESEQDFPSIEQFLSFLSKRINALEGLKPEASKSANKYGTPAKTFHTNSEPRALPKCTLCSDKLHRLCDCPEFLQMSLDQRRQYLKQSSRCFNCLAPGHDVFNCKSRGRCHQCKRRHHTSVHVDPNRSQDSFEPKPNALPTATTLFTMSEQDPGKTESIISEDINSPSEYNSADALLPTAIVQIRDHHGIWQTCRALLDSASTRSYISERCATRLKITRENARFNISTLNGGRASSTRGVSTILIRSSRNHEFTIDVTAYIVSKITSKLPHAPVDREKLAYIDKLPLADPDFHLPSTIDVLIGCDRFLFLLLDGQKEEGPNLPIAQNTKLGWIVGGMCQSKFVLNQATTFLSTTEEISIDLSLRKFWEMEELPTVNNYTDEEKRCISHFNEQFLVESSGKFTVPLPFKPNRPKLGDSLTQALRRFNSLEQKLAKSPDLRTAYSNFLTEYELLGHMELIPPGQVDAPTDKKYYLPHHPIIKEASTTTKLRVVFDASAKSTSGASLNDMLMVGPTIQQTLLEILIRFRKHRYVFTADIEKMFRQLWIKPSDTDYQRIVWRDSPSSPIKHYRLLTNTYGTASASFLATMALTKLAQLNLKTHPKAATVLMRDFYMDDLMSGAETIEEATQIQSELISLLQIGGYNLRKWATNDVKLLEHVPESDREITIREITEGNKLISVLGVKFDPQRDCFLFKVSLPTVTTFTKRIMLSEASRIFDPMGWLSPVTVGIKIIFQGLWMRKLDWDDQLPIDVENQWMTIRSKLESVEQLRIPRWLNTSEKIHLCGFSDASNTAYAAVIYARTVNSKGEVVMNIVSAKTKVAPIKYVTIARLELCAALLLTRMLTLVIKSLNVATPPKVSLWSDSTTVLAWLVNPPRKGNVFVINRVTEILDTTNVQQWSYVPSKYNPADCASRGVLPDEISEHNTWWQGPDWLRCEPYQPPNTPNRTKGEPQEAVTLLSREASTETTDNQPTFISKIVIKFSKIIKAVRVLAWIKRASHNFRNYGSRVIGPLTKSDVNETLSTMLKDAQLSSFSDEITNLRKNKPFKNSNISFLSPYLDSDGIMRVGGRLENAKEQHDLKHPIILSGSHPLAKGIVRDSHIQYMHAGPTLLLSIIRQKYTILRCKSLVRSVVHNCIKCFRQRKITQEQLMGQLPLPNINLIRAFLQTSVDYAGPYVLKNTKGRNTTTYKGYLVVFTCMATKAVHFELASDMTTDTFLSAFKRFQNRRGICTDIYSDNGTNFIGAANDLQYLQGLLAKEETSVVNWAAINNTNWHFVPPASPHFNGLCEAAVKSLKYHLRRVIGQTALRYEELNTLLTQVEALLNSRPLSESSEEYIDALTPGHFIIGQPITTVPEADITHLKLNRLSRWQMIQQLFQHFAKRWQTEYLTSLNRLSKWRLKYNNLKEGDLVILKDDNIPPGQWAMGRIVKTHAGKDSIVRVVTLKTATGFFKRPITKICLLPAIDSPNSSTGAIC